MVTPLSAETIQPGILQNFSDPLVRDIVSILYAVDSSEITMGEKYKLIIEASREINKLKEIHKIHQSLFPTASREL